MDTRTLDIVEALNKLIAEQEAILTDPSKDYIDRAIATGKQSAFHKAIGVVLQTRESVRC